VDRLLVRGRNAWSVPRFTPTAGHPHETREGPVRLVPPLPLPCIWLPTPRALMSRGKRNAGRNKKGKEGNPPGREPNATRTRLSSKTRKDGQPPSEMCRRTVRPPLPDVARRGWALFENGRICARDVSGPAVRGWKGGEDWNRIQNEKRKKPRNTYAPSAGSPSVCSAAGSGTKGSYAGTTPLCGEWRVVPMQRGSPRPIRNSTGRISPFLRVRARKRKGFRPPPGATR
jgi:hypothetical protein